MSEILCTMPGCQTTAGCQCRNRASMTAWRGQIAKDALILNIANPSFAAGVSLSTVRDFEKGRRVPIANNLNAMRKALEVRGVIFPDGGITYAAPTKIVEALDEPG